MNAPEVRRSWSWVSKLWPWLLACGVAALWVYGRASGGFTFGTRAGDALGRTLVEMAALLPAVFILVGLFEVWVPRALVERYLGEHAGSAALLWMILLAVIQAGPIYVAFPVAASLWRKGCTPRNVFVYLGTFSAVKIPMVAFEVAFLGWRFSLARVLITLPVVILMALLMEKLLRGHEPHPTCRELTTAKGYEP